MNNLKNNLPLVMTVIALLLPATGRLSAEESYRIESNVYVFKHSDFPTVKLPAGKAAGDNGTAVIHSPAAIGFGGETLSLNGADFSWSGGRNPPARFTLSQIPDIVTGSGKPVEILSTEPVEYLEKQADGTLQVRIIDQDSPDAPHCRIRFTVMPADAAGDALRLTCNLDVATVSTRERIPGVSLNVGRPLLARFQDRVELAVRPREWAALLLRAPNGSDYSLLLLLKIMPAPAPDTSASQGRRRLTAEELTRMTTYYYRQPQPELIGQAIESLDDREFLGSAARTYRYHYNRRGYTCVGLFAEIFAAHPERLAEWRKIVDRQDGETRSWLGKALKLSRPGAVLEVGPNSPESLGMTDIYWGAFCASGNPAYLRKLVDRLELVDDARQSYFEEGGEVMVLFVTKAPHHPLVRQTLEAARQEASPRTRELIDDLLNKDVTAVLQEIRNMDRDPDYPNAEGEGRDDLPWRRPSPPPPWSARP